MTTILSLLKDLGVIEILRVHTPPHRLYLLDLELALRLADERDDQEPLGFFLDDDADDEEADDAA